MNRCQHPNGPAVTHASRRRTWGRLAAALGLTLLTATALAQSAIRSFPPKTQRGAMVVTQPPELLINGTPERLSPGARIRGANNLLILSATLVGQNLLVNYLREPQGLIHEVWILTEAEAAQPLPPTTP